MRKTFCLAVGAFVLLMASPARGLSFPLVEETHIRNMVNLTRAAEGLRTLVSNDELVEMARGQAVRMAERRSIYHNPNLGDEATALGLSWRKLGENVGMGPDADLVQDAFLKSPHHYENIVDPSHNSIGIGEVIGKDGTRFIVQVMANLVGTAAPVVAEPPAPVSVAAPKPPVLTAPPVAPAAPRAVPAPVAPVEAEPAAKRTDPNAVIGGLVDPAKISTTL